MLRRFTAPLALALALALVLPTACAEPGEDGGDPDFNSYCGAQASWSSEWAAAEEEVLAIVNARRAEGATCGGEAFAPTGPMGHNAQLRCAARLHSADMSQREFFSHTNLDDESFVDRINQTDYEGGPAGENIALGYPTPEAVMDGWMTSPGHCRNIMHPDSNEIGIGYYGDTNHWTQVMGRK